MPATVKVNTTRDPPPGPDERDTTLPMKSKPFLYLVLSIGSITAHAQSPAQAGDAERDWTSLMTLKALQISPTAQGVRKPAAQLSSEKANAARNVALTAKNFHLKYPTNVYAGEARKLEAAFGLLGAEDASQAQKLDALQVAGRYRADRTNPAESRFEVALLIERMNDPSAFVPNQASRSASKRERVADKLRVEFGDIPEVFNLYASIARAADMTSANALAAKMLQWPSLSRDAKIEAQSIVDRHRLLAKPLGWKLAEVDSKDPLDLAKPVGKPVLIFVSWLSQGASFGALKGQKAKIPANFQVLYLTLGATEEQARAQKPTAPIPGIHCYEPRGSVGPSAEQFQVRQTPYLFAVNRTGALAGYGPLSEISSLVEAATR